MLIHTDTNICKLTGFSLAFISFFSIMKRMINCYHYWGDTWPQEKLSS